MQLAAAQRMELGARQSHWTAHKGGKVPARVKNLGPQRETRKRHNGNESFTFQGVRRFRTPCEKSLAVLWGMDFVGFLIN